MTSTPSTTDRAREAAGTAQQEGTALAQSAKDSGAQVAHTATAEASHVASEAKAQAGDLLRTTRDEVNTQVDTQRRRLVDALRTTGDELGSGGGQSALTTELSSRASTYARRFADYLDERGPDAVLDDVRSFARRRPGTFLLLAGAAGVVAGRVFRSVSAASGSSSSATPASGSTYSGLGAGATEPIPAGAAARHAADDDVAVGVAEVPVETYPPVAGSPAGGYATPPVAEPYAPVGEPYPPVVEPAYEPRAGYTGDPAYDATRAGDPAYPADPAYAGDSAYPAAPPGAPAAEPLPPVPPAPGVDDPFADPRYRDPRGDQR